MSSIAMARGGAMATQLDFKADAALFKPFAKLNHLSSHASRQLKSQSTLLSVQVKDLISKSPLLGANSGDLVSRLDSAGSTWRRPFRRHKTCSALPPLERNASQESLASSTRPIPAMQLDLASSRPCSGTSNTSLRRKRLQGSCSVPLLPSSSAGNDMEKLPSKMEPRSEGGGSPSPNQEKKQSRRVQRRLVIGAVSRTASERDLPAPKATTSEALLAAEAVAGDVVARLPLETAQRRVKPGQLLWNNNEDLGDDEGAESDYSCDAGYLDFDDDMEWWDENEKEVAPMDAQDFLLNMQVQKILMGGGHSDDDCAAGAAPADCAEQDTDIESELEEEEV